MPTIGNGDHKRTKLPIEALGDLDLRGEETKRVVKHLDDIHELARDPINTIQRDIATVGLVGEEDGGLLLYLAAISRLSPAPLRLIIQGPSGSGKSEIPRRVVPMCPPEAVLLATDITANALFYLEPGSLEHKLIVNGERKHRADDDAADKTAPLRQLISEGRIVKVVTVKNGNEFETKTIEQNGPVAYVETTTSPTTSIFAEDLNRCLLLQTDDSPEQTAKVMQAVARRYSSSSGNEITDEKYQAILDRHREFQLALERIPVVIPYAADLAARMPTGRLEARRAITQVLGTIEAIALMHQFQRERDADGRLEATPSDYATARRLLLKPLTQSIGFSDRARKAYDTLRKSFPHGFNTAEAEKDFTNKMTCNRALNELRGLDVLEQVSAGKSHTPARWQWTDKTLDELVLPSARTVFVTS